MLEGARKPDYKSIPSNEEAEDDGVADPFVDIDEECEDEDLSLARACLS